MTTMPTRTRALLLLNGFGLLILAVVIGWILSSTFLTLVLLPVLYAWVERPQTKPEPGDIAPVPS